MTSVTVNQTKKRCAVNFSGHAGYNRTGHDLVCASASCLAYTLVQRLVDLGADPKYRFGDGSLRVSFKRSEKADDALSVVLTGIRMLQEKYPEYVSIRGED